MSHPDSNSDPDPEESPEPRQVPAAVRPPMFISSRLMAALTIGAAGTVHLIADGTGGRDGERRVRYRWVIDDAQGRVLGTGNDLCSTAGAKPDYLAAAQAMLAFLEHTAEAATGDGHPDGALFNPEASEWAHQHADELAIARLEIDTNPGNHPDDCEPCREGNTAAHLPRLTPRPGTRRPPQPGR